MLLASAKGASGVWPAAKEEDMRIAALLFLITSPCLLAESAKCHDVGGGITTNFVDSTDTLGTATGDLAGGLGVHILGQQAGPNGSLLIQVQHHWVTETGDTVSLDPATVTLFPTPVSGFYAASYINGVTLDPSGGTGALAGVTGTIYAWGAVDFNTQRLALRYFGQVCHSK
jgi:hypothetical protein